MTGDFVGARWWRFDFHTHTPKSMDYGKGPNQKALKERTPREWLLDFMRAGIDCVAITDHNTGEWVDELKQANDDLASDPPDGFRPLVLFPGVEISVNGGIHMLAILDPSTRGSDIASLLGACGFPPDKQSTSEGVTTDTAQEVARKIQRIGGLAIPAHADTCSGIFKCLSGQTLIALLTDKSLSAIELVDPELPDAYKKHCPHLATVIGSDSHHPAGEGSRKYPGKRYTWVKMGQPSLTGLRLALLDGDPLSIRRSDRTTDDPNTRPGLTIESVEVEDARYMGHDTPATAEFSPWLSSIIGGRGTGKSTLVEMVRLGLCRENDLPEILHSEFRAFASTGTSRSGPGALLPTTKVRVNLRKDGALFRTRWQQGRAQAVLEERAGDDTWKQSPGEIASRFPIKILSQKEIFSLASDPDALLDIVDDADPVRSGDWKARRKAAEAEFLRLRSRARELSFQLSDRTRLEGELADLERRIALFEEGGHRDLLRSYQRAGRQRQVLLDRAKEIERAASAVRGVVDEVEPSEFQADTFEGAPDALSLIRDAVEHQAAFAQTLRDHADSLESFRTEWVERVAGSPWHTARDKVVAEYRALVEKLAAEGVSDPETYGSLVQRRRLLQRRIESFGSMVNEKAQIERNAQAVLDRLESERLQLSAARNKFLRDVLSHNDYVRMECVPFGLTARACVHAFREAIARGDDDRLEAEILGDDNGRGVLANVFAELPDDPTERAAAIKERVRSLKKDSIRAHHGENPEGIRKRLQNYLRKLKPEQMDRLSLWWPDDGLRVRYRRADSGDFKSLSQGSPGQKSAAILAFLLSYGEQPIILDQPEDDLDNQLIYSLVVEQIRTNKRRRQVIVVTHNPNIVVNGDAEAVISMAHRGGQCVVARVGCLQDKEVRTEICSVMEGGRKAFEDRYQRLKEGFRNA